MWSSYVSQNLDTPARTLDGEAIVITPHDSLLHTLNDTATFIWERADGTRTLEMIAAEMRDVFDVEPSILRADAIEFVRAAVEKGLMFTSDEPKPL